MKIQLPEYQTADCINQEFDVLLQTDCNYLDLKRTNLNVFKTEYAIFGKLKTVIQQEIPMKNEDYFNTDIATINLN